MVIPDDIVQQFRVVALQRLERVEAAWSSLLTRVDDDAAVLLHREVHTLKGESRMVGFTDVNLVCHKLEDLLQVSVARGFAVDEDFDLAVNMAFRFIAMLVRKKVGAQLQGIDLPGFIRQIDALLVDAKSDGRTPRPTGTMTVIRRDVAVLRIPVALRDRLAPTAVDAFVEYAAARGARRDRLRSSWHALRELVGLQRALIGPAQLNKYKAGAASLARDLGKEVVVAFDIDSAEITTEVLAAIDLAVLHLLRNAVDHGIEGPAERAAAGKPRAGSVHMSCTMQGETLELSIEDDGRGIVLDDIVARARELGVAGANAPDARERWVDLLCHAGFSTRTEASDVSGRGLGLDAVRAAIDDVGGKLSAVTMPARGTTWTVEIPLPHPSVRGHVFRVAGVPFPLVVDHRWSLVADDPSAPVIDVGARLGLVDEPLAATPRYLSNGTRTIGIASDRVPSPVQARRIVAAAPPAYAEVVTIDVVEGLLIHPERLTR